MTARQNAAQALQTTGFTVLALILLGSFAAILGGAFGAGLNGRAPMTRVVDARANETRRTQTPSYT